FPFGHVLDCQEHGLGVIAWAMKLASAEPQHSPPNLRQFRFPLQVVKWLVERQRLRKGRANRRRVPLPASQSQEWPLFRVLSLRLEEAIEGAIGTLHAHVPAQH